MTDSPTNPIVTWTATYIRYVTSRGGGHPDRTKYRPKSCREEDEKGDWAGFYEVADLTRLDADDAIGISSLRSRDGKPYASNFIPRGPIIIGG